MYSYNILRQFTTFQQFQNYDPVDPHCILANSDDREHTLSNATLPAWVPKIGNGRVVTIGYVRVCGAG